MSAAFVLDGPDDPRWLKVARGRRTEELWSMLERLIAGPARFHPLLVPTAAALAGTVLVTAYAFLLSRLGVAASLPALLAVLLASTLSSLAGFAFSAVCGAMLLQMMNNPVLAVEIMMVCSIAIQSLSIAILWQDINWGRVLTFSVGGAIGLPVGVWLLLHLRGVEFKDAIGVVVLAYATYLLVRRPTTIAWGGGVADSCAGFLGGITGGLAGFPGAPVTIWCGLRGWGKRQQRGVFQPFILIMRALALVLIQAMRPHVVGDHALDFETLAFIPTALLGTWFGLTNFGRLSDTLTVNLLLLLSGIGLLV
jgi:uncharacterized membrane protein YfcA